MSLDIFNPYVCLRIQALSWTFHTLDGVVQSLLHIAKLPCLWNQRARLLLFRHLRLVMWNLRRATCQRRENNLERLPTWRQRSKSDSQMKALMNCYLCIRSTMSPASDNEDDQLLQLCSPGGLGLFYPFSSRFDIVWPRTWTCIISRDVEKMLCVFVYILSSGDVVWIGCFRNHCLSSCRFKYVFVFGNHMLFASRFGEVEFNGGKAISKLIVYIHVVIVLQTYAGCR